MAKKNRWLMGCGIGCAALVLLVAILGSIGALWVQRTFHGVSDAARSQQALVESLGDVEGYVPPADGSIAPDRLELFLTVRESLGGTRDELHAVLADFPPDVVLDKDKPALRKIFGVVGSLADLINPIARFIELRNEALLEKKMGLGEYLYIYFVTYYSWLGNYPEDGPVITKEAGGSKGDRLFDDPDSTYGPGRTRRRYRRIMLAVLRNQLGSLSPAGASEEGDAWRQALAAEISRFESRPGGVAWEDGLPPVMEDSLKLFADRLEAAYDRATNCFEVPVEDNDNLRIPFD